MRRAALVSRALLPAVLLGAIAVIVACDPVVDDARSALGPDVIHPGQPCLLCHDGDFGDPPRFTIAGTVFQTTGSLVAATNATVNVVDATGASIALSTNAAGNFYATPGQFAPTYPFHVSVTSGGRTVLMETVVGGNGTIEENGACASCHFDPAGPDSPGHVALTLDDGGVPP